MQVKNLIVKFFAIAMLLSVASHADSLSPYLQGRLNFVVDDQLVVRSLSAEGMDFAVKKESILGSHLTAQLPLSEHDSQKILRTFARARETQQSQVVHYWLGAPGSELRRYFEAKLIPLNDAGGAAGFFIRVREVKLFDLD